MVQRFIFVAPLVGARIEISKKHPVNAMPPVAPLVGARIEITLTRLDLLQSMVAPLVGARIEIGTLP